MLEETEAEETDSDYSSGVDIDKVILIRTRTLYTGCPDRCGLRNWALTEMFYDFRGPQTPCILK